MTTSTMNRIVAIGGAILLALALSAAFAMAQTSGAPTSGASYVPPTDSVSGQAMLDIIIRANRDEIRQSRSVAAATRNAEVRRLAESLVGEHAAVLASANALVDRLGYTRADTATTFSSTGSPADTGMGAGLGGMADSTADQSYLTARIAALQSLSTQLKQRGPVVQEPAVRTFALELQASIDRQLASARQLQAPPPRAPGQ